MVDTVGMGYTERRKINEKIITEKVSYREGFRTMIESVHHPFSEMEALVKKGESFISKESAT
jgi:2-hydroxy-3-keto-5-methylthiopentenyl-1-phosphate phosphatase